MTVISHQKINNLGSYTLPSAVPLTADLVRCLLDYIDRHGDGTRSFDVLRALACLTVERIEERPDDIKFQAVNITTEAKLPVSDNASPGSKLSKPWKRLTEIVLPEREKGIQDFLRIAGFKHYPWPAKDGTPGGLPSHFYLVSLPLPESVEAPLLPLAQGEIMYIQELTPEASWWARSLFKTGYRLEGWRRWLYLGYGLGSYLLAAGILITLWLLLFKQSVWSIKDIFLALAGTTVVLSISWSSLAPLFRLSEWRIVMAPDRFVALKEFNVQMEIVNESRDSTKATKIIRLVRYASTCSICGSKIELRNGGKEFPNRMVGRCSEYPSEHVYSFDRYDRRGKKL